MTIKPLDRKKFISLMQGEAKTAEQISKLAEIEYGYSMTPKSAKARILRMMDSNFAVISMKRVDRDIYFKVLSIKEKTTVKIYPHDIYQSKKQNKDGLVFSPPFDSSESHLCALSDMFNTALRSVRVSASL